MSIKKCKICKEEFDTYATKFTMHGVKTKTFCHFDCFVKKELSKKTNKMTKEQIEVIANDNYVESLWYIKELDAKDILYKYIMNEYDVVQLPQYIYTKLSSIFNGTKEGMNKPFSPVYFLDIWKQQQVYLNSLRDYKTSMGSSFSKIGSINYDIAVVLGMADDYLDALEQNEKYHTYATKFEVYSDPDVFFDETCPNNNYDKEYVDIDSFL